MATAVLVGALVVGNSVRGSLRELALDRLGPLQWAIIPGRPFPTDLADNLAEANAPARPIVLAPATASARTSGKARRANGLTLIGGLIDPGDAGGLVTESLAQELGIVDGDAVVVRVSAVSAIPSDSPLGEKQDTTRSVRLRNVRVVPSEGLNRFSLMVSQTPPRNLFVTLEQAQRLLEIEDQCTAVVVESVKPDGSAPGVEPTLDALGLVLIDLGDGVWQLESENLVLSPETVAAAEAAFGADSVQRAITYLANRLDRGERSIPYSTVTAIGGARVTPLRDIRGERVGLSADEIVLSDWAADDLGAAVGDTVTLRFYEPESTHGVLAEAPPVSFTLAAITPVAEGDPRWTPQLEGVTDAESINEWDLPFELVETIRQQDEDYWDEHGTTPKAFIDPRRAASLWSTRWGTTSLVRFRAAGDRVAVERRLLDAIDPDDFGFTPVNIRKQAFAASSGNTPFDVLFLLFSMFLIVSAAALIALLVRLSVEARASEVGLLGAMGFTAAATRRLLMRETLLAVGIGSLVGAAIGVAYAAGLLALLRTVWIDAIGTPFLRLHVGPVAVVGGVVGGFAVGGLTAWRVVAGLTRQKPKNLIQSRGAESAAAQPGPVWPRVLFMLGAIVAALGATVAGKGQQGEAAAGAFFVAGGATLAGMLTAIGGALLPRRSTSGAALGFWRVVAAGIARNRGRALLILGLVASASFLVLATSAFRLSPTEAGVGGFAIVAESDQPILFDLDTADGRFELGFSERDEELLAGWRAIGFRVQPGEDASCRNLYQPRRPRVLGVPLRIQQLAEPFAWAATEADPGAPDWSVLDATDKLGDSAPIVLDFNTAVYSLKLYGGVGEAWDLEDEAGRTIETRVAGLLKNSVLQGDVLMGEQSFLRHFPEVSGEQFFLLRARDDAPIGPVIELLEDRLSDFGFDAEPAATRLARFLAVQNTYLSTFQSLGAFGLLLGVAGLAIAQYRNLVERRGELALMRAAGFSARRLGRLVLAETLLLVGLGLGVGAVAAGVALAPLGEASGNQPPWAMAGVLVAALMLTAIVTGRLATRAMLAAPLTPALRGD